jgi:hypothetical protein
MSIVRERYTPPAAVAPCRDCGEDLAHPHPLGAHLPGCGRSGRTQTQEPRPVETPPTGHRKDHT